MKPLDDLLYVAVRGFVGLVRVLPRPVSRLFCRSLAAVVFLVDRKHRRIGGVNLSIAFPERAEAWKQKTLRESFLQLGDLAVELSRLDRLDKAETLRRVVFDPGFGLEHYREARALAGGGILFLTAHVGPWELLPAVQALSGHPLSFLVRPLDNARLEAWLGRRRSACGNEVLDKNQSLRGVLRRLKEGRDVGFLIDQNVQVKDGVFAPFFGYPACTASALAALALRTGTPVVPGFIHPGPKPGHYRIRFHPPLRFESRGDRQADLIAATAQLNQAIESAIRNSPSAWLWGHRRFQTQPDGSDPYRT